MTAVPLPLVRRLVPAAADAVRDWWAALSDADRADLLARWDGRANRCPHTHDADGWHRLPVRVGVRFLPADPDGPGDDWQSDYLEHLLNNPVLHLLDVPWRTFHICTAHPAAQAALAAGVIPADFACPFAAAGCPMRRLLAEAPGREARLTLLPTDVDDVREERVP